MALMWILVIIAAHLFFSLSYLGDKLILSGPPKPRVYTFFAGITSIFAILLIPFVKFSVPGLGVFFWIISEALVFILGLYVMFLAIEKFDVSKVMATIGATQPILIFILTWFFWGPQTLSKADILAFILLFLGSIIISAEKGLWVSGRYLKITLLASLLFSLEYVFSKIVYLSQPFLSGFIWMRLFIFLFALALLLSRNNRKEIFAKQNILNKKTGSIYVCTHLSGGVANILQAFAVSLTPVAFLPILNSFRGVQYVFLFLMVLFLSVFFPKILKEEISRAVISQKIISIILIVCGLAILMA